MEVRRAVAGRDEAEHNLQLTLAHLGECRVNLEEVSSELLRQQERSDRGEAATLFSTLANLGKYRLWPSFSLLKRPIFTPHQPLDLGASPGQSDKGFKITLNVVLWLLKLLQVIQGSNLGNVTAVL